MEIRPIDANALREEILTEDYDNDTINIFLDLVDLAPNLDYEPVVHCKDCEHFIRIKHSTMCGLNIKEEFNIEFNTKGYSNLTVVNENGYCSHGKKVNFKEK